MTASALKVELQGILNSYHVTDAERKDALEELIREIECKLTQRELDNIAHNGCNMVEGCSTHIIASHEPSETWYILYRIRTYSFPLRLVGEYKNLKHAQEAFGLFVKDRK